MSDAREGVARGSARLPGGDPRGDVRGRVRCGDAELVGQGERRALDNPLKLVRIPSVAQAEIDRRDRRHHRSRLALGLGAIPPRQS